MEGTVEELMHNMPLTSITDVTDTSALELVDSSGDIGAGEHAAGKEKKKKKKKKESAKRAKGGGSSNGISADNSKLHYILRGVKLLRPGQVGGGSGSSSSGGGSSSGGSGSIYGSDSIDSANGGETRKCVVSFATNSPSAPPLQLPQEGDVDPDELVGLGNSNSD
jgi:hypothetical protein